jgi:hypothetical protein
MRSSRAKPAIVIPDAIFSKSVLSPTLSKLDAIVRRLICPAMMPAYKKNFEKPFETISDQIRSTTSFFKIPAMCARVYRRARAMRTHARTHRRAVLMPKRASRAMPLRAKGIDNQTG